MGKKKGKKPGAPGDAGGDDKRETQPGPSQPQRQEAGAAGDTAGLSRTQQKKLRQQLQQQSEEAGIARPEAGDRGELSKTQQKKLRQQQQQESAPQEVAAPQYEAGATGELSKTQQKKLRQQQESAPQEVAAPQYEAGATGELSKSQQKKLRQQESAGAQQQPQRQPEPPPAEVQTRAEQRRDARRGQPADAGRGRGRGQPVAPAERRPGPAQEVEPPAGAGPWFRGQTPQPDARGQTPPFQGPPPGMGGPRGQGPPPGMGGPRGQTPPFQGPPPGMGGPRGQSPSFQGPPPGMGGQRGQTPPLQGLPPGMGAQRGQTPPRGPPAGKDGTKGQTLPQSGPRDPPQQPRAQAPQPSPSRGSAEPDLKIVTKGVKAMSLDIPRRKSCGREGRRTVVEVNYLALNISRLRNSIAYHYDCKFEPELPKRLLRPAMEEYRRRNFPRRYPAFDGRKNLYSVAELPEIPDEVSVYDSERDSEKSFKVVISLAGRVDLRSLTTYMQDGSSMEQPQRALQALDIVLRNAPIGRSFVPVGRSFFTPPTGRVLELGEGLELWVGMFQSAILGWKPFLNIDVAHKGFPKCENCVDSLTSVCNVQNFNEELRPREIEDFSKYIKGLKIEYKLPDDPSSKRTYRVNGLVKSAAKQTFELDNGQGITVAEYFRTVKRRPLRYPKLPCLFVGSLNRPKPIYVPLEFCTVIGGQALNRKMTEGQTANMIKFAATNTDIRKQKIRDALRQVRFNDDPCVQEFGLSVGGEFEKVPARVLNPPKLKYGNREESPRNGVWRGANFVNSPALQSWAILNLDRYVNENSLRFFVSNLQQAGGTCAMSISEPTGGIRSMSPPMRDTKDLEAYFEEMKKKGVRMVFVVVPDRGNTYARVKQTAELTVGMLTQCVKATTINRRVNMSTCSNILLKVNSKLNGINHELVPSFKPRCLQCPVMIVGADVTHPSPDQKDIPSIAAVCASHDPVALFKYNIQIRLQPARTEIIEDLKQIMRAHLKFFYVSSRQKPQRIIFFRDGVSEGQFSQVLNSELTAIRDACQSMQQGYTPLITFLVVQKRHHTRFFPTKREDEDGRNRNVPPGLVVDEQISHPIELDFFLVSHASIQGVSRPTKYHMLWNDDDEMTTDEIEKLTYYLCHMFSRCTRSVSYPAPTYYAHLAAFRARAYIDGRSIKMTNLAHEQKQYFETAALGEIIQHCPMYFV